VSGWVDYPAGVPEDEYEPAPAEFNLQQARAMLERLYGGGLETIPEAGLGACADCGREAILLAYCGRRNVCRRCALSRRGAAASIPVPVRRRDSPRASCISLAGAGSQWTGWRRVRAGFVRDPRGVEHPPSPRRKRPAPDWSYWRKEAAA
jgi:hypothetical protein